GTGFLVPLDTRPAGRDHADQSGSGRRQTLLIAVSSSLKGQPGRRPDHVTSRLKTWHPHTQWWLGPPADAPHHPPFVPRPAPPEASSPGTARTRKTDPRTRPRRTSSTILSLAGHVEPLARGNPYSTEAAGANSTTL